jgi:hypothetical protein
MALALSPATPREEAAVAFLKAKQLYPQLTFGSEAGQLNSRSYALSIPAKEMDSFLLLLNLFSPDKPFHTIKYQQERTLLSEPHKIDLKVYFDAQEQERGRTFDRILREWVQH